MKYHDNRIYPDNKQEYEDYEELEDKYEDTEYFDQLQFEFDHGPQVDWDRLGGRVQDEIMDSTLLKLLKDLDWAIGQSLGGWGGIKIDWQDLLARIRAELKKE